MAPSHALAGHRHSFCRNRHCPKCQAAASRRWLADREAELLPVPYFHVVYTLPSELRDIAYQNKRVVYDLLMKAAAETTLAIAADPKRLGARIGVTAVLHTWGSALTQNPHSCFGDATGRDAGRDPRRPWARNRRLGVLLGSGSERLCRRGRAVLPEEPAYVSERDLDLLGVRLPRV